MPALVCLQGNTIALFRLRPHHGRRECIFSFLCSIHFRPNDQTNSTSPCGEQPANRQRCMRCAAKTLTVEEAHHKFNPWFYSGNPTRGLNAADAARVLARYGYLRPESRPLLARGALRGAAIVLDGQPYSKNSNSLEREYAGEEKRVALEQKAANYIVESGNFSGDFQMEEGESWFCEVQKNLRWTVSEERMGDLLQPHINPVEPYPVHFSSAFCT